MAVFCAIDSEAKELLSEPKIRERRAARKDRLRMPHGATE